MSCALSEEVKKKMDTCPYVLDIDLDFFSTRNPFYSIFNEKQFDILRKLYHYEHPTELTDEILRQVTAKRREQLSELKSIFNNVRDGMDPSASPLLSEVEPLLDTFPDRRPPDPDLLNDAGCTCDDCDLPHHVSTPDEVRHLVGVVKDFLLQNPKPAIITIARSSRDDYCPPEDVNFIQECVLQMLEEVYGSIDVSRDYETDNSEEETAEGEAA
ncbi:unnamed protein product [Larinioides sclopetarius]|uniref:Uncharacterized protein n=1 Tax=Larinioides sclopetarius TaxID=280406 RepID=A0AAV2BF92_9ARAC